MFDMDIEYNKLDCVSITLATKDLNLTWKINQSCQTLVLNRDKIDICKGITPSVISKSLIEHNSIYLI